MWVSGNWVSEMRVGANMRRTEPYFMKKIMEIFKKFKIGHVYVYVSSRPMKRRCVNFTLTKKHRRQLMKLKSRMYDGFCQECGRSFREDELEIHHIVPLSENPRLVVSQGNLQLVCPECHARLHGRPFGGKTEEKEQ